MAKEQSELVGTEVDFTNLKFILKKMDIQPDQQSKILDAAWEDLKIIIEKYNRQIIRMRAGA